MGVFNCFIINQRNVTDSNTACLSVTDIAGCATWAAELLAATLAVDLLLSTTCTERNVGRNFPLQERQIVNMVLLRVYFIMVLLWFYYGLFMVL
jgi:hypothetical protein